ncbi:MAG: ATP-binding protein [Lachnospiraceae bacterium]|nr:ATP-binding protein [Lachnospiraceae bacterium]
MEFRTFTAEDEEYPEVCAYVEGWLEEHDCPMKAAMQLTVALEEIFVNIAHYAYPHPPGKMDLGLECEGNVIRMCFIDSGTPFDPLAKEDPDVTLSVEERGIGGLGIFMVKKTMDDVTYEFKDGKNILTLTKNI